MLCNIFILQLILILLRKNVYVHVYNPLYIYIVYITRLQPQSGRSGSGSGAHVNHDFWSEALAAGDAVLGKKCGAGENFESVFSLAREDGPK